MTLFSPRTQQILGDNASKLKTIPAHSEEYFAQATGNCENMIGTVKVPVGVVGPLQISGERANGSFIVPMATTEGALIASTNRGCKAISQSGGAEVTVGKVGISRAPVFQRKSNEQIKKVEHWLQKNITALKDATKKTSNYLELLRVETTVQENYFFIKFWFDAKDAMGMNMATIATEHLIKKILVPQLGLEPIALSSNWCADKKPSAVHLTVGRGFQVSAEVTLSQKTIREVLKTTPQQLLQVYESKLVHGSELAGSLGQNAHYANIIAAIYLATGQDMAHVVEGSHGITSMEEDEDGGLWVQVYLPALVCGVVGGGTHLPTQQEALQLMGIEKDQSRPGRANQKFAEIVAATVLAGELSLLAALASGDLAGAHEGARKEKLSGVCSS